MPEYLSPGVYVEEVDRGPKPIEGVGTAMAAFVGFTEKAEVVRDNGDGPYVENLLNQPQLITNWTQFVDKFGGFVPGLKLPHAVTVISQTAGPAAMWFPYARSRRQLPRCSMLLVRPPCASKRSRPVLMRCSSASALPMSKALLPLRHPLL